MNYVYDDPLNVEIRRVLKEAGKIKNEIVPLCHEKSIFYRGKKRGYEPCFKCYPDGIKTPLVSDKECCKNLMNLKYLQDRFQKYISWDKRSKFIIDDLIYKADDLCKNHNS